MRPSRTRGVMAAIDARVDASLEPVDDIDMPEISEAGGSALRTPRGKAYDWGSCSTLTLQRCKEVQEEHADEIIGALSDRGGAASGSRDGVAISMAHDLAVDTCAALFDGCDAERASLHLDVLVEAAAEAAAEAAGSTERDEL